MTTLKLFYATNRRHIGLDRWRPEGYDQKFSTDSSGNLRFGELTVEADEATVSKHLSKDVGRIGVGDGEKLSGYLAKCARNAAISAYPDPVQVDKSADIPKEQMGAKGMFSDVQSLMKQTSDVLIHIHGFNVDWHDAVGSALALQAMLRNQPGRDREQDVVFVLFTWPSDGKALPWVSYKSDRREAEASGEAIARAMMILLDYLRRLRGKDACQQDIHLLCHSMGNFVLQSALPWIDKVALGRNLSRIFGHVFLCAPDIDDDVLEEGRPLGRLHEMASNVTVYYNRGDAALHVSDYTKGNPERLGSTGPARPGQLHQKIHQVDCSPIVGGVTEHSYYQCGRVNADIRMSIDGVASDDSTGTRPRARVANFNNVWKMTPAS